MNAKHLTDARVVRRERTAMAQFWALVECPPEPDACWRWRGATDRTGRAVLRIWRTSMHAARVSVYAVTGEYPTPSRFTHACGDARCVRPSHLQWSTSVAHRREVAAVSDGYGQAPNTVHPAAERAAAASWSGVLLAS